MNSRAIQKYNRYQRWWQVVEKNLLRIALMLFLVLYASQLIDFVITQRGGTFLSSKIVKLEGKAISDSQTKINTGTVELTVISNSDYKNLQVYINGERYAGFSKKSISLTVKNNDIIEVSGIKNEYPAKIKVTYISDNILDLKLNKIINVNKNFAAAGRVRLK